MDIILSTLNSTYQHAAFGLRYLYANLDEYQDRCEIIEWTIHKKPDEIVQELRLKNPKIFGLGVYIWNTDQSLELVRRIKSELPHIILVLGGPEVSYESESQEICRLADYVIKGEADFSFKNLCRQLLSLDEKPIQKFVTGSLPEITEIKSPYAYYSENDIKNRIIYVEASRGCPYKCEYCLSSLDKSVRNFPLDSFIADMQMLLDKGVRQFKFIDRTFNLSPKISGAILKFFLDRKDLGLFLHFEMVPDRLPEDLKLLIQQFPAGSLQFEIGIQTFNPQVAALVSRKNDLVKVQENLQFLSEKTAVHTHVDLIAGLPGETIESFALGFDRLLAMAPHEIQVGILKRLKGTPIIRHDREWEMNYSSQAPFQILSTKTMSAEEIISMQKFSKYWDLIANRGHFITTWQQVRRELTENNMSAFAWFMSFSYFLSDKLKRTYSIPLLDLYRLFFDYLIQFQEWDRKKAQNFLAEDYRLGNRQDLPEFLQNDFTKEKGPLTMATPTKHAAPARQQAHLRH